ncbi:MAG: GNAT family N-acetyltransferase [Pyrinomonadaceae bacterium]
MKTQIPKEQSAYPIIETERLLLRMFKTEDLDVVYQLFSDADVQKYLSAENRRTREQLKVTLKNLVRRWDERGFGIWCVTEKNTTEIVGYCGFQYFDNMMEIEILFAFLQDFWGSGFATEAAKACLRFWFEELTVDKILAATYPKNIASRRVLEKIGMRFVEQSTRYNMEAVTYLISRNEYQADDCFYKLTFGSTLAKFEISNSQS